MITRDMKIHTIIAYIILDSHRPPPRKLTLWNKTFHPGDFFVVPKDFILFIFNVEYCSPNDNSPYIIIA